MTGREVEKCTFNGKRITAQVWSDVPKEGMRDVDRNDWQGRETEKVITYVNYLGYPEGVINPCYELYEFWMRITERNLDDPDDYEEGIEHIYVAVEK